MSKPIIKQIEGSKKRKRSESDHLINESNHMINESNDILESDIWANYKYTDSEINRMNFLINKYKSKPMNKKIKKLSDNDQMLGWVSATRTKYYLLHDQSIDWLNLYFDKIGIGPELPTPEQILENTNLLKDASHIELLFEGGNVFEKKIYEELADIYGDDFVLVFNESDMKKYREEKTIDGMIRDGNNRVKQLMNQGTPIIAQAPLINDENKTFGVADILIRSDYLEVLFKTFTPDAEINIKAPLLKMKKINNRGDDSYHYRVIDCKWTTMVLCVDGLTIRNDSFFPAYKGQLAVYTAALESLQGYIPKVAYIMAKAWRIDKANIPDDEKHLFKGFSAFDRPGVINYAERDRDYLIRTKEAIQWMQQVMTEGREWRYELSVPKNKNTKIKLATVEGMYPNMNKSYNPTYDKVKETLAQRYGDPTMVWYVGTKHRDNAHAKGIYDIRDPKCTLSVLGIPDQGRGPVIKEIIKINTRNQTKDLVRPKKITNNLFGWKDDNMLDYYVDFETINYNLFIDPYDMDIDNSYFDSDVTFMIGFGFNSDPLINSEQLIKGLNIDKTKCNYQINIDKEKGWEFICLYLVNFKLPNELEMFRLFYQFTILRQELVRTIYKVTDTQTRMFHWTAAELRFMSRAIHRIRSGEYTKHHIENKQMNFKTDTGIQLSVKQIQAELDSLIDNFNSSVLWIDMCKVFEKVPIVVKGSFRFKLKHIGNAFYANGLIDTHWGDGKMSDGFRAMMGAIRLYRTNEPMDETNQMFKEIIDYNEVDCRVVWEIVNYLRSNH